MSEQVKTSWQYHPLSGQELLKWIMADIWAKLSQDAQFGEHLVYHNPIYRARIEVEAFDGLIKEGAGPTSGAVGASSASLKTSQEEFPESAMRKLALELNSETKLKEPDRARELLDDGRYKVTNVDGVLVDKKVKKSDGEVK